jgi:hypothetical protein
VDHASVKSRWTNRIAPSFAKSRAAGDVSLIKFTVTLTSVLLAFAAVSWSLWGGKK